MTDSESELAMVRRHVREGAEIVDRQLKLLARLQADGHSTDQAKDLLNNFEDIQREHETHLARIMAKEADTADRA